MRRGGGVPSSVCARSSRARRAVPLRLVFRQVVDRSVRWAGGVRSCGGRILRVFAPAAWVLGDVLADIRERFFTADDVFVIAALPDGERRLFELGSNSSSDRRLVRTDDGRERTRCGLAETAMHRLCRGTAGRALLCWLQCSVQLPKDRVDMIRHDHVGIECDARAQFGSAKQFVLSDHASR